MMYLGPDLSERNMRKTWKEQTHCMQGKGVEEDGNGEKRLWLLGTTYIPIVEMPGLYTVPTHSLLYTGVVGSPAFRFFLIVNKTPFCPNSDAFRPYYWALIDVLHSHNTKFLATKLSK